MASSNQLKLVQNNAILDRINSREGDWSGFAIELCVKKHSTSYSYKRLFYKREADFLLPMGIERFLSDIIREEQVLEDVEIRGIQLTMPNPGTGSLPFSSNTVFSLEDMALFAYLSLWILRNDPINRSIKILPIQMDLKIQRFQRLDLEDSIIWDAIDHDYYAADHEEFVTLLDAINYDYYAADHEEFVTLLDAINHDYYAADHEEFVTLLDAINHDYYAADHEEAVTLLDAINHDYYAADHEEAVIIRNAMDDDDNSESLSNKERAAVQALKEMKLEASSSSSVECSICLESVGVGRIASQTPCSHIFHSKCILRWIHKKPSCPLCRAPLC
ncbi:hypothetical protein LWI28_022152 [Acer negundo]|uniref:RING-type E3 ubiquitin transferase n=1 Tax=Acer negundo TaxID=4023 RepID=A0AAD5IWL9_ACENE|nr:hypothetical protein LWI28_022152 [Acer negundo]